MSGMPMARPAVLALIIAAVVAIVFTLNKVDVDLPWTPDPYVVQVQFEDAAGLDGADHPLATVAGTKQGRVVAVHVEGDKAVATLELEPSVKGKVFKNASAVLRPIGAVPVLSVNVDPGDPSQGEMPSGGTIKAESSTTYVAPDKVLSVLDADTRAYLQVLLGESDVALKGRGGDLEDAVRQSAPMMASIRRVTEAVADRRRLVTQLVGDLNEISTVLARRRDELASVIDNGSRVLDVTAARSPELEQTMRELPATLESAQVTLRHVKALAGPLTEAMDGTLPALEALPDGLSTARQLTPAAKRLISDAEALEKTGKTQLPAIREFTSRLGSAAAEGRPSVEAAARTVDTLADYSKGVAQLGDLVSGAVSTSNVNGVMGRAIFSSIEPVNPANFGFDTPSSGASTRSAKRSATVSAADRQAVEEGVAKLLEEKCATDKMACILRALTPGLPGNDPVTKGSGG